GPYGHPSRRTGEDPEGQGRQGCGIGSGVEGSRTPTSRVRCLSRCAKASGSSRKERKRRATRPSLLAALGGLRVPVHRQNTDSRPLKGEAVVVDDAQRAESHVVGVDVFAEREGVPAVEPVEVRPAALRRRSYRQRGGSTSGGSPGPSPHRSRKVETVVSRGGPPGRRPAPRRGGPAPAP